jgi:hypothetical protein
MRAIKKVYGLLDAEEKEKFARLLVLEINSYLSKIYSTFRKRFPDKAILTPQKISASDIILKNASMGATKSYEFVLNSREEAARGKVGKVMVITRGLSEPAVRKQRALFIAAECYVYHAYASHHDPAVFRSIRCQNQYWDLLKKLLWLRNSHDSRDRAVRYVIEEVNEHKIANHRGNGWYVRIAEVKKHHPEITEILGSTEATFREIFRKQKSSFTPGMLRQEEDLVRKEEEDISHLIETLKSHERKKYSAHYAKLIDIHIADLETFRDYLERVRKSLDRWVIADREEHRILAKKGITKGEMRGILRAEAEAEEIDINKVHLVFNYFEKEKINILRDIELLERMQRHQH